MKTLIEEQKKGIKELMLKRAISKKYLENVVAETPEEVKLFDPEAGDKESEEYKELQRSAQKYDSTLKQLNSINEANQGDIFAYSVIDKCAEEVDLLLQ